MGNEEEEDEKEEGAQSSLGGGMKADPSKPTVGYESQPALSAMPKSVMSSRSVAPERRAPEFIMFDEFLAQVSFKRTTEIQGYSSTRI